MTEEGMEKILMELEEAEKLEEDVNQAQTLITYDGGGLATLFCC